MEQKSHQPRCRTFRHEYLALLSTLHNFQIHVRSWGKRSYSLKMTTSGAVPQPSAGIKSTEKEYFINYFNELTKHWQTTKGNNFHSRLFLNPDGGAIYYTSQYVLFWFNFQVVREPIIGLFVYYYQSLQRQDDNKTMDSWTRLQNPKQQYASNYTRRLFTALTAMLVRRTAAETEAQIPCHASSWSSSLSTGPLLHASNLGCIRSEQKPSLLSPFGLSVDPEGNIWNPDTDVGAARNPGASYRPWSSCQHPSRKMRHASQKMTIPLKSSIYLHGGLSWTRLSKIDVLSTMVPRWSSIQRQAWLRSLRPNQQNNIFSSSLSFPWAKDQVMVSLDTLPSSLNKYAYVDCMYVNLVTWMKDLYLIQQHATQTSTLTLFS